MSEIRYVRGDATVPSVKGVKVIAHVCNDLGGWGKGFVLAISRRWPEPEAAYRAWHRDRASNDFGLGAVGYRQLMPQYFAVLPEVRGHGLGRLLWRAAMHWGQSHAADYQLLQTEVGGASDRLCRAEGLTSLGFVCTRKV
ncbi:GNAT family N-acetyltransferase [Streptomyces sp. NPDC058794]|uniref:GNAT family N-acetyltransferase n=1 Tax=unclassified Streptomyces TaxID=2593676 RepID=UPI0036C05646